MPNLTTPDGRHDLARRLTATAIAAGQLIMEVYASDFEIEYKSDASPVTAADTAAEKLILTDLATCASSIPVIAEEAAAASTLPDIGETFFLVDPLDGTKEFVRKSGEFTVNIALVENRIPTMGVIFAPVLNRLFVAWGPGQAFECPGDAPGNLTALSVRARPETPTIVASRSHRNPSTEDYLQRFDHPEIVCAGSSLKFCLVACGEADIYPRLAPTCEWDTGAGHAILASAGGQMKKLDGSDFLYGKTASNYLNPGFIAWGSGEAPPFPEQPA
jgi:3'(2'), 5'-bisphosphate nucleotidase